MTSSKSQSKEQEMARILASPWTPSDAYARMAKRIMPSPRHYAALMSMWDFLDRELNSKQGDDWLRPPPPLQPRYALEKSRGLS